MYPVAPALLAAAVAVAPSVGAVADPANRLFIAVTPNAAALAKPMVLTYPPDARAAAVPGRVLGIDSPFPVGPLAEGSLDVSLEAAGNLLRLSQAGWNNQLTGSVSGAGNRAVLSQAGSQNTIVFHQIGTGNTLVVRQGP